MRNKRKENLLWYGAFFLCLAAFVYLNIRVLRPVYLINDDWSMYSILSGAYSGTPEAHIMYIPYPMTWLLSRLYTLFPGVQWYGTVFYGSQLVCLFLVYQRVLRSCRTFLGKLLGSFVTACLFVIINLWTMSVVQFTLIAATCAGTTIFLFLTSQDGGKGTKGFLRDNIPTFITFVLAINIRMEVMGMMMPIAGMIWLGKWGTWRGQGSEEDLFPARAKGSHKEPKSAQKLLTKENAARFFGFVGVLAVLAGLFLGIHAGTYARQPWRDIMTADFRRSQLWDYHGWPDYDKYADRLEAMDIDREMYGYIQNNIPFVGYGLSVEDWNELAAIGTEAFNDGYTFPMKIAHGLSVSWSSLLDGDLKPLNTMTAFFYVSVLLLILFRRRFDALFVYGTLAAGRMFAWLYILLEGRFPSRLPQSFFVVESIVLMAIVLQFGLVRLPERLSGRKQPAGGEPGTFQTAMKEEVLPAKSAAWRYLCYGIWGLGLLALGLAAVHNVYTVKGQVEQVRENEADWTGLKDYCAAHPDKLYLWYGGSDTLNRYCDSVFDAGENAYQNYFFAGSVYAFHQVSLDKMEGYGITDMDQLPEALVSDRGLYCIFAKDRLTEDAPLVTFLKRLYPDLTYRVADSFQTEHVTYQVYEFKK